MNSLNEEEERKKNSVSLHLFVVTLNQKLFSHSLHANNGEWITPFLTMLVKSSFNNINGRTCCVRVCVKLQFLEFYAIVINVWKIGCLLVIFFILLIHVKHFNAASFYSMRF